MSIDYLNIEKISELKKGCDGTSPVCEEGQNIIRNLIGTKKSTNPINPDWTSTLFKSQIITV